jgi:uncharacterized metal-binding protein YceD (DUF177 family)
MTSSSQTEGEFPRLFDVRQCEGKQVHLVAEEAERVALAKRFDIVRVDRLEADLVLTRHDRDVAVSGTMRADIVQPCAVSAEDLPVTVEEEIALRFIPAVQRTTADEEIELEAEDLDEIEYDGTQIDVGEAVAQSLALAIDPFLTGPEADGARQRPEFNNTDGNAFSALKDLKL